MLCGPEAMNISRFVDHALLTIGQSRSNERRSFAAPFVLYVSSCPEISPPERIPLAMQTGHRTGLLPPLTAGNGNRRLCIVRGTKNEQSDPKNKRFAAGQDNRRRDVAPDNPAPEIASGRPIYSNVPRQAASASR